MQFIASQPKQGLLMGRFKDDEGRNIEVRYDTQGYYCHYKAKILRGESPADLEAQIINMQVHKLIWTDVLIIRIDRGMTSGCPPSCTTSLNFEMAHIAKTATGGWVKSYWCPTLEVKPTYLPWEAPTDMTLPHKLDGSRGCSSTQRSEIIVTAFNEATVAKIKVFQTQSIDRYDQFVNTLVAPRK